MSLRSLWRFLLLSGMFVQPIIVIMNMIIICRSDCSICCFMAGSWQHSSLSCFISTWRITKFCCIYILIMLIILSREHYSWDLTFLCLCRNCLEKVLVLPQLELLQVKIDRFSSCCSTIVSRIIVVLQLSVWGLIAVAAFKKISSVASWLELMSNKQLISFPFIPESFALIPSNSSSSSMSSSLAAPNSLSKFLMSHLQHQNKLNYLFHWWFYAWWPWQTRWISVY